MNFADSPASSLCKNADETIFHLFCECPITLAILGFFINDEDNIVRNPILLIFKFCIYKYQEKKLNLYVILKKIKSIYQKEKLICLANPAKFDPKGNK